MDTAFESLLMSDFLQDGAADPMIWTALSVVAACFSVAGLLLHSKIADRGVKQAAFRELLKPYLQSWAYALYAGGQYPDADVACVNADDLRRLRHGLQNIVPEVCPALAVLEGAPGRLKGAGDDAEDLRARFEELRSVVDVYLVDCFMNGDTRGYLEKRKVRSALQRCQRIV